MASLRNAICLLSLIISFLALVDAGIPSVFTGGAWESAHATFYGGNDASGTMAIAIISVREGLIQLGSLEKIDEDLNLVTNIQRKFNYLQSIPGVFSMQRSIVPLNALKSNTEFTMDNHESGMLVDEKQLVMGGKRCYGERIDEFPSKAINLGWNSPQNRGGVPLWSIPPLFPTMSCSFGALLSNVPSLSPYTAIEPPELNIKDNPEDQNKPNSMNPA